MKTSLRAGFAEVDITPIKFPIRTYFSSAEKTIDPIFAHAAVFENGRNTVAFLSLDVVIIEKEYVQRIRKAVKELRPISEENIMVCATHNHACPAVVCRPNFDKEDAYIDFMIQQAAKAVIAAFDAREPVEIAIGRGCEGRISFNRRFIKKNGTVISQPNKEIVQNEVLCNEGVIDPEIGVLCVRDSNHKVIGMLVNFASHACHLMGSISAGYPGVLCDKIKEFYGKDCICVFLNGACGNVIHRNYVDPQQNDTKEITGGILADDVKTIVDRMDKFTTSAEVSALSRNVNIKYRDISGLEKNINNLERYNIFPVLITWYKYSLEKLKIMHEASPQEDAELQVLKIGDAFFGAVPAEYFAEHSLRIKSESPAARTFVVSLANGWLGYIPHKAAFERIGGHESTWAFWSKMEHDAGDILADNILKLIKELHK